MEVGDTFHGYQIKSKLGSGGYATCYRAFSPKYQHDFCIKIMRAPNNEKLMNKIFEQEVSFLRKVGHENVVKLYDFFIDDNKYVIILEYLEGGTLQMKLDQQGCMPYSQIQHIFVPILQAVQFFHSENIVHRDIKPTNICFDTYDRPKLIDWGFSTSTKEKKYLTDFCGTFPYASPENITKKPYNGKATDIWALGVTLYMCAFNRIPWAGETNYEQCNNLVNGIFIRPDEANIVFIDLLQKMLNPISEMRLTIDQVLKHPFFEDYHNPSLSYSSKLAASQPLFALTRRATYTNQALKPLGLRYSIKLK